MISLGKHTTSEEGGRTGETWGEGVGERNEEGRTPQVALGCGVGLSFAELKQDELGREWPQRSITALDNLN